MGSTTISISDAQLGRIRSQYAAAKDHWLNRAGDHHDLSYMHGMEYVAFTLGIGLEED